MSRAELLVAFSQEEAAKAQQLLAARVAYMMGRKFEEGDWSDVYCAAKGIPRAGWSNLNIDVMHEGLGVEHKMLGVRPDVPITRFCGTAQMHPSLTRAIRISSTDADPDDVMREVFEQYGRLVDNRRKKVAEGSKDGNADLRTGWLLWQSSLREFMYFEERMSVPDYTKYRAEWAPRPVAGSRLSGKSLWIYDDEGKKRYSVTTGAGVKIQPYFEVPPPDDERLFKFTVQGMEVGDDQIRVWITSQTASQLASLLGKGLNTTVVSDAIMNAEPGPELESLQSEVESIVEVVITRSAYERLVETFNAPSDELRFRALVGYLEAATTQSG